MTHAVYQKTIIEKLPKWLKRQSRRLKPEWLEAALILIRLNLDPARDSLQTLYSPSPRGRRPYDPICMLRALILLVTLQYKSIESFANDLRAHPRLALLAGFAPFKTPAVGTCSLFIDRLEDGAYHPSCPHRLNPSRLRKGQHRRNLKQEKATKEQRKKHLLAECDSLTQRLKDDLLHATDQPRPDDVLKRLEDLLITCAVIPSAQRGLLGDLNTLILSGDGSALVTGASPEGKPTCSCRKEGIFQCDHDRFYADPSADWGYDSYREWSYFGHTFYQHTVSICGHDLPLHLLLGQASETDFTLSLKSLDRLEKTFREHGLEGSIFAASYDSGHDALGIYDYHKAKGIRSVIALNPRAGEHPKPTGTAQRVNKAGIPICPAGLLMRRHAKTGHRLIFNCPVKRPTHEHGQYVWKRYEHECPHHVLCQPDTLTGPTVSVRSDEDPRYYPEVPRGSQEFKRIMHVRSGCERSNSLKKVTDKLDQRPCRSASHFLVRLYLISLVEHAKAWLAEDRTLWGEAWEDLLDLKKIERTSKKAA